MSINKLVDDTEDLLNSIVITIGMYLNAYGDEAKSMAMTDKIMHLPEIQNSLNFFFKDSNCKDVILVNNSDKLFFGINVIPAFNGTDKDRILNILLEPKSDRISEYMVEIDSKILDLVPSVRMITALLLREVNELISSTTAIDKTKDAINQYITEKNKPLRISKIVQYNELLAFAIKDCIHKTSSIFYTDLCNEIITNEFIHMCGLDQELEDAINIISKSNISLIKESDKFIVMRWALDLYDDIKYRRIDAIETIDECIQFTGSYYEKIALNNIKKQISAIDDSLLLSEFGESIKDIVSRIRYRGIANIEDDLYEYAIRIKTANTEDEARLLMREINNRIAILSDYMEHEEIPENARDRWQKVYDKYIILRDKLAAKPIAKYKYMQLWVEENPDTLMT